MNREGMDDDEFDHDDEDEDFAPESESRSPLPFSDEVLRLVQQIKSTRTKSERMGLMAELALTFAEEHDETDESATDLYHDFIDEYRQAQVSYQQAALRLARLAVQCVDVVLDENQTSIEEVIEKRRLAKVIN